MARLLVALASVLAGCSPTVTRTIVMERATAESLGSRATIVSGGPAPNDSVKARVVFHQDESVPGEGVVRARASQPMLVAGITTLVVGAGVTALIAACPHGSNFFGDAFKQCAVVLGPLGGTIAFTGIVIAAAGASADGYVERAPRAQIVPTVSRDGGGLSFALRF